MSQNQMEKLFEKGKKDKSTQVHYTVTIYLTKELGDEYNKKADYELMTDHVVAAINQGYINSKIPLRLRKHCVRKTTISEKAANNNADTLLELTRTVFPDRGSADTAALLTKDGIFRKGDEICGLGDTDGIKSGRTFTVQPKDCALDGTMAHEIGHNFGALHDISQKTNPTYPYGQGYQVGGGVVRTIMAYGLENHPTFKWPLNQKINFWSNPDVSWEGNVGSSDENEKKYGPLPTGVRGNADNARLLRENR